MLGAVYVGLAFIFSEELRSMVNEVQSRMVRPMNRALSRLR